MNYADHFAKHLRIALLKALDTAPARRANSSILHSAMDGLGLTATRDQVKTELAWLAEQGLLTVEDLGGLYVATLTERGLDVAEGRTVAPGVQRPAPR
jgi:hypothetical protein